MQINQLLSRPGGGRDTVTAQMPGGGSGSEPLIRAKVFGYNHLRLGTESLDSLPIRVPDALDPPRSRRRI